MISLESMAHRESSDVNFKDLSPKSKNVQSFSTLLLMVFFFSWILFDLSGSCFAFSISIHFLWSVYILRCPVLKFSSICFRFLSVFHVQENSVNIIFDVLIVRLKAFF